MDINNSLMQILFTIVFVICFLLVFSAMYLLIYVIVIEYKENTKKYYIVYEWFCRCITCVRAKSEQQAVDKFIKFNESSKILGIFEDDYQEAIKLMNAKGE